MKIVFCLRTLCERGGIERVTACKANYWAEHGHEVHIITTGQRNAPPAFDLHQSIKLHDLGLNYDLDNKLGRWRRLLALRCKRHEHKTKLEILLNQIQADVCVSTFFEEAPILPSITSDGSKKILELHSSQSTRVLMYPPKQWLLRAYGYCRIWQDMRLARKYDRFVVLAEEEREYWKTLSNIVVIPNPTPYKRLEVIPDKSRERVILAVGRYAYQKNFSELIRLFSTYLAEEFPDWTLEIVGSGPLRHLLTEQVKSLGMQDRILLLESTPQICDYYLRASIYAMTSHFEGLPMVLIEAQTMGLPIVSYTSPAGPRDVVTDGHDGILVEQYDEQAMAEALRRLMRDKDLRVQMGKVALTSSERFVLPIVMGRWKQLFDDLLKR